MESAMSQFVFQNPAAFALLLGLPAIAFLFNRSQRKRLAARKCFYRADQKKIGNHRSDLIVLLALFGAYLFIVLALCRPGWNPRPQERLRQGRDVAFVLDASRSMLAEDVAPNRLERAKSAIADCLQTMTGDRVGLVVFAGAADVECPLTVDYDCFRKILRNCDQRSVSRGGSMLATGMHAVVEKLFAESEPGYQDVVLITDGEDHGSQIDAAIADLENAGARLIVVGIGNPETGARIPVGDEQKGKQSFSQYQGRDVLTRLHSQRLRDIVAQTDKGVYFDVGTGMIDLGKIYRQLIAKAERETIAAQGLLVYDERFQVFIGIAVLMLSISYLPIKTRGKKGMPGRSLVVLAVILPVLPAPSRADSARHDFENGLDAYAEGKYSEALEAFEGGLQKRPDNFALRYNTGVAQYSQGNYSLAEDSFTQALQQTEKARNRPRTLYNLGDSLYRQAETLVGQDLPAAKRMLARSAACYRRVLDIKPESMDAAYNLEIANTLAAALEKAEKKDEQQDSDKESDQEGESGDEKPKPTDQFKRAESESEKGKRYLMPTEDPEDILEEERRNNEQRLKRIEQQAEGVDKDW